MEAPTRTEEKLSATPPNLKPSVSMITDEQIRARVCEGEFVIEAPRGEEYFCLDLTEYCKKEEEKYQAPADKNDLKHTIADINRQETFVYKSQSAPLESRLQKSELPNYYLVPRCDPPGEKFTLLMQEIEREFNHLGAALSEPMRLYIQNGFHQDGFLQKVYGLFVMAALPLAGYTLDHAYTNRVVRVKIIDKDTIEIEENCAFFALRNMSNPGTIILGSIQKPICCLTNKFHIKCDPLDNTVSTEVVSAQVTSCLKAEDPIRDLVETLTANPNDPSQWMAALDLPPPLEVVEPALPSSPSLPSKTITQTISTIGVSLIMFVLFMALGFSIFSSLTDFALASEGTRFFISPVVAFSIAGFTVAFIAHMITREWQLSVTDTPASQAIVAALQARNILNKWISLETERQNGTPISRVEQNTFVQALLGPLQQARALLYDYPNRALATYPDEANAVEDYAFLCSFNGENFEEIIQRKADLQRIFQRLTEVTVDPYWAPSYPRGWKIFWSSLSVSSFIGGGSLLFYVLTAEGTVPAIGLISGITWSLSLVGILGFIAWKSMEHVLKKNSGRAGEIGEKFLRVLKIILVPTFLFSAFFSIATMFPSGRISILPEITDFLTNVMGVPWPNTFSIFIFAISSVAVFGLIKNLLQIKPTTVAEFKGRRQLARGAALFFKIAIPMIALASVITLLVVKDSIFSGSISVLATFLTIALAPLFSMKTPFKNLNAKMQQALSFWSFLLSVRPVVGKWEEVKYLVYGLREAFILGLLVLFTSILGSYDAIDLTSVAAYFFAICATEIYRIVRLFQQERNPKVLAQLHLKNPKATDEEGNPVVELANLQHVRHARTSSGSSFSSFLSSFEGNNNKKKKSSRSNSSHHSHHNSFSSSSQNVTDARGRESSSEPDVTISAPSSAPATPVPNPAVPFLREDPFQLESTALPVLPARSLPPTVRFAIPEVSDVLEREEILPQLESQSSRNGLDLVS